MTIINFPSPPLTEGETYEANGIEYTWDGEKWVGNADRGRDTMVPPDVTGVTLTKTTTGNRFTSQTYNVNAAIAEDGDPVSAKFARVKFTNPAGIIEASPLTDEITNVVTTQFSDGITVNPVNDNSWRDIYWCGPPYNCYVAQGNGSSAENFATSTDGRNWTRHTATLDGADWNPPGNFAYSPLDGTLRVLSFDSSTNPYRKLAWTTDGTFSFDFTSLPDPVMPSTSSDSRFGDLYWDEVTGRWWAVRIYATWDSVSGLLRGPTTADFTNGWTDVGGPKGEHYGRVMIHQDGSATCTWDGRWTENTNTVDKTYYWADPVNSTTRYSIAKTGWTTFGRWAKVGTIGWVTAGAQSGNGTEGNVIFTQLGDQPPNAQATAIMMTAINPDLTGLNIRDSLYIEDLGLAVICGNATTATRNSHGCIITTTDCVNFDFAWTNEPGDDSQYRWSRMFWNTDRQELVLVADQGTNPGVRAGYSQTLGGTIDLPQLTFISAGGLASFSVGMNVTERNGNATGVTAEVNVEGPSMIIKATENGPWNVGSTVEGPASTFGDAFGVLAADGNVTKILPETFFVQMDSTEDFDLQFPATFEDGRVPDTVLPADTTIEVEYRARSEVNGFIADSNITSNQITPT